MSGYWQLNEWGGFSTTAPPDRGLRIPSNWPVLWPDWYVQQARARRDVKRSNARIQMIADACRVLSVEGNYPR